MLPRIIRFVRNKDFAKLYPFFVKRKRSGDHAFGVVGGIKLWKDVKMYPPPLTLAMDPLPKSPLREDLRRIRFELFLHCYWVQACLYHKLVAVSSYDEMTLTRRESPISRLTLNLFFTHHSFEALF